MNKWIDEIRYDLGFLRSHTLQPRWFKILKVFILVGLLAGYALLLGPAAAAVFLVVFFSLAAAIHFVYRARTRKYTRSWLDFRVGETDARGNPRRIGKYYYPAVLLSAILAFLASLAFA